ncbi:MAG: transcription-repair coupling factor [Gemmatimonas sp.]|nr:transcription-repair coupling factor [Gemmatimonas sp.]
MPHSSLVDAFQTTPSFAELARSLPAAGRSVGVDGLVGSSAALLLGTLHRNAPERIWVAVANGPDAAEHLVADVESLLGEGHALLYPQRESLAYESSEPDLEIGGLRVEAVEALLTARAAILVTTQRAIQERSPSVDRLDELQLQLSVGIVVRPAEIVERLQLMGFERVASVEEVGQFASRGGILDLFGFGTPEPVRVEFWGDQIESIRRFDVLTQLSVGPVEEIRVLPVDVRFAPPGNGSSSHGEVRKRSVLSYLPPDATLFRLEAETAEAEWKQTWAEVQRLHAAELKSGSSPEAPDQLFSPPDEVAAEVARFPQLFVGPGAHADACSVAFQTTPPEPIERDMQRMGEVLRLASLDRERTLILCDNEGQLERLQDLLADLRIDRGVTLATGSLRGGFILEQAVPRYRVLTDHEIFRRTRRLRRRRQFRGGVALESFAALKSGDYVVHMDHGIGRFRGMEHVRVGEEVVETLVIEYAGGELLRVPVHRIDLIERWVSDRDDSSPPRVHKIGGREWSRTRDRTRKAIEEMAAELVELYASREAATGFAYSPDTRWQKEMESGFLFEDTPDQRQATEAVKQDMESQRPMDRLVCGDVGYGKTEVAIRAAFKAVQDGRQVAVLVPTTILAEQHLHSFSERLAGFPVRIEALSRFRTAKEQAEVLEAMKAGAIDIVIGTHRLLSTDVEFCNLGLLVVDEEQRFGVKHKERLKQLKRTVDVLTLTATPIPRTLQFSLLGIRDMTLIQTPPRDRQPIITHVLPWSDAVIEDAIQRELDRGGQVFFVHNRIETIHTLARRIQTLIPKGRIAVGHGQMREKELEEIMRGFVAGEVDILVATSIIESGLDVPNANTLIVDRADQFGLAQLYQIRGRVGRSHHRAYGYLLIPENVSEDAEKRLRVLEHFTELGSGFGIALRDLELRGAGNILGSAQSGFVHTVGFDTYMRMLDQAVRRLKGEGAEKPHSTTEVSIDGAAYIPDEYVPDEAQKLHLYRRLSSLQQPEDVDSMRRELRDRYGPLVPEVETLLDTETLRLLGTELGVERILVRPWDARLNFCSGVVPKMAALQRVFTNYQLEVELQRTFPLSLTLYRRGPESVATMLIGALRALTRDRSAAA